MVERRRFICILCPRGCEVEVEVNNGRIMRISGNQCAKGLEYVRQEVKEPMRTVISVVKVRGGDLPTVSVKTDRPVPKRLIPEIMKELAELEVNPPIRIGEKIIKNLMGMRVNVVATRPVNKRGCD